MFSHLFSHCGVKGGYFGVFPVILTEYTGEIKNPESAEISLEKAIFRGFYGAGSRTRTGDLLITNQLLYQLSYIGHYALKYNRFSVRCYAPRSSKVSWHDRHRVASG